MPSYPGAIPSIPTLTGSDYPKAEHLNAPNREIEAICHELGINPRSISPLLPKQLPQSVAEYLDMMAYIVKTMVGASAWNSAAVPLRFHLGGGGNAGTVAAGATSYLPVFGRSLAGTEANIQVPVAYACTVVNARCQILSAQPGTGSLVFTLRKNGADTALTWTLAAGTGANIIGGATGSISYAAGDLLTLKIVNNASAASAQIGSWSCEIDQAG